MHTSKPSAYKWRNRFRTSGLDGLKDLPRSGPAKKLSAAKVKEVLTLTVERIPKKATHWSTRLIMGLDESVDSNTQLFHAGKYPAMNGSSLQL